MSRARSAQNGAGALGKGGSRRRTGEPLHHGQGTESEESEMCAVIDVGDGPSERREARLKLGDLTERVFALHRETTKLLEGDSHLGQSLHLFDVAPRLSPQP